MKPKHTRMIDGIPCMTVTEHEAILRQLQAQEPVAWMWADGTITTDPDRADGTWTPLYTAPRQWQGLTDEEVHQGFCHVEYETPNDWNTDPDDWCQQFARYLEAKLKEKNEKN